MNLLPIKANLHTTQIFISTKKKKKTEILRYHLCMVYIIMTSEKLNMTTKQKDQQI